jgi:hypothetical protein
VALPPDAHRSNRAGCPDLFLRKLILFLHRALGDERPARNFRVYGADETIKADISRYQAGDTIPNDNPGRKYWRYITAWETLRKADGLLSPEQSMDLLSTISVDFNNNGASIITQYSVISTLTVDISNQATLFGILDRIRDLNIPLITVINDGDQVRNQFGGQP